MADNKHYVLTVPVEYQKGGETKTRYSRVGVVFENTRSNNEKVLNIKLDFPIGAQELVAFEPRSKLAPED